MVRAATAALMAVGLIAATGFPVPAQSQAARAADSPRLSAADRQFVQKAAQGGLAEVALGQLAERKGQRDSVKQFGRRMTDDHSKANDELKRLAEGKGVALPKHMTRKDERLYNRLQSILPDRFDAVYSRAMVQDHQADIREFEREARRGHDPEVKAWAERTLPTLREHLQMARGLEQNGPRSALSR